MDRSSNLNLLDEAFGFENQARVSPRVLLIEDCVETSGAFVLHHLIKRALSLDGSGVLLFVALAQPFSHYERILRKLMYNIGGNSKSVEQNVIHSYSMVYRVGGFTFSYPLASELLMVLDVHWSGCNLVTQRDNNRLFFLDMLKLVCPDGDEKHNIEGGLVELYGKIQKTVEVSALSEDSRNCITIMIDDISLMEVAANGSSNHVLDFLHYCYTLTSELGGSLVTLNHEDIYSSTLGPTPILHMEYIADIIIKAEPLATGLATDVHGQLTVVNKGIIVEHGSPRNRIRNFHFKVKENGIEYFYPGSQT
ncbi:hypothetical protein HHK36_016527 [Tetracentron sinense]|uniref:Elongator complex protein 6 n=1 Tax=Tetracentron sinense TaxID=13715 RepID=A0A835DEB0_TETSI|nr:hypothetical protein HHK36_016527 [Tetracentron sinense]